MTLSVTYRMKGMDEYGVRTGEILGERTSGTAHWAYLIGDDERAYRYEFSTDMLIVRETPFPARYGRQGLFASKTAGVRDILMFSEAGITGVPNSRIAGYAAPDGYEFINMAAGRIGAGQYDASKYYCIARTIEGAPKTVKIISTSSSLSSPTEIKTYDEVQPMLMNANTRIVTTKLNGNAYYDYDNKIYHWAMTGVDPVVPAEGAKPDITLPDGEQIMDICTNAVPSTSSAVVDDDQLLIATYNPTATGRKPGSLYVYSLKTMEKVKEYVGICEKPVAVAYKFPTSN